MNGTKSTINWVIAFTIWISGAVTLWALWRYHYALPDPAASFVEFAVMFISTFYVLVLFPIKYTIDHLCGFCELTDPILES